MLTAYEALLEAGFRFRWASEGMTRPPRLEPRVNVRAARGKALGPALSGDVGLEVGVVVETSRGIDRISLDGWGPRPRAAGG